MLHGTSLSSKLKAAGAEMLLGILTGCHPLCCSVSSGSGPEQNIPRDLLLFAGRKQPEATLAGLAVGGMWSRAPAALLLLLLLPQHLSPRSLPWQAAVGQDEASFLQGRGWDGQSCFSSDGARLGWAALLQLHQCRLDKLP